MKINYQEVYQYYLEYTNNFIEKYHEGYTYSECYNIIMEDEKNFEILSTHDILELISFHLRTFDENSAWHVPNGLEIKLIELLNNKLLYAN